MKRKRDPRHSIMKQMSVRDERNPASKALKRFEGSPKSKSKSKPPLPAEFEAHDFSSRKKNQDTFKAWVQEASITKVGRRWQE
jgi:hypothetical protein